MNFAINAFLLAASLVSTFADASLYAGQSITPGNSIYSSNGSYRLILQGGDGNLVLYRNADTVAVWSAYTYGGVNAKMQEDRNFVVYSNGGNLPEYALWSSNTYKNVWDTQTYLEVRNDGSLYLWADTVVIWATPPDPSLNVLPTGPANIPFAACARPGTRYQSAINVLANNYVDAVHRASLYVNDGVTIGQCH